MNRTSRAYADEVSARVNRVINSIRSTSPVHRSPVYVVETPIVAAYELNRIDNHCRALAVENDILRDRVHIQSDLIVENSRTNRELSKVAYENEVLKMENKKVPEYEQKLRSAMRQSQEVTVQLGKQAVEAESWKNRFSEADTSAATYRSLYQTTLMENERCKNEIQGKNKELAVASVLKYEVEKLHNQNQDLADVRLILSHELVNETQENAALREKLKQVDVLKAQLLVADQEKKSLRELVNNQHDINTDLRTRLDQAQEQVTALKAESAVIPQLNSQIEASIEEATKLTNLIVQQENDIKEKRAQVAYLNTFEQKCSVLQGEKQLLQEEQQRMNQTLLEKINQIRGLEIKAAEVESLSSQVKRLEEDKQRMTNMIVDKSKECEELKVKNAVIPGLEDKLEIAVRTKEALSKMLSEREASNIELNKTIASLNLEIAEQNKELAHMGLVIEQNDKLNDDIDRLINEIENLKVKLAKLSDVEYRLSNVQAERETLSSLLSSKLDTVKEQNMRIADLEEQLSHLEQLRAKVVLVVEENETLNKVLLDKMRANDEWALKYDQLERLYVSVKETTEQLEFVKNKYQTAVKQSESYNPNLRNSAYKGRNDMSVSRYSVNSEVNTMLSPSDITASPPRF